MERYEITNVDSSASTPHTLWRSGGDTLLVMLPGLGYTNDMPIMFYLQQIAMKNNWDVLRVDYDYREVPREELGARFVADARPLIDSVRESGNYQRTVLAGKSIGTRVMTSLLADGLADIDAYVWLTPILVSDDVLNAVLSHSPSLTVFGDADDLATGADLTRLEEAQVNNIIVGDADHSLQLSGKVEGSIKLLAEVMRSIDEWLSVVLDDDPVE